MASANSGAAKAKEAPEISAESNQEPENSSEITLNQVDSLSKKYAAIASGAALIPFPVFDLLGLAAIQLKLLHEIGKLHDQPIKDNAGKAAISTLVTTIPANSISGAAMSVLKIIPGVGSALGLLTLPTYYAASTYAVGRVFHAHFASGGTLFTFDPEKFKEAYKKFFTVQTASA